MANSIAIHSLSEVFQICVAELRSLSKRKGTSNFRIGSIPRFPGYNLCMRWGWSILSVAGLAIAGLCADQPVLPVLACAPGFSDAPTCNPSKKDLKLAKKAFDRGLKLQNAKRSGEALEQFEMAARLAPQAVDYVTAQEMARQQLVYDHIERGNAELLKGRQVEALAEFRSALHFDPQNEFAQQRLRDAAAEWAPKLPSTPFVLEDAGEVRVTPKLARMDFHFRGDSRELLSQVAAAFGVTTVFDDSVTPRRVRFDIQGVDFYTAMLAACAVTRTFWTPLAETEILLASESPENHRQFDRMALRTFYVPGITAPKDLNDIVNLLRTVFEIRFVTPQPQAGTIVVRAPQRALDAATQWMETLWDARPEVMLDVHVYAISHS
jgi:general secretion pathway protein D